MGQNTFLTGEKYLQRYVVNKNELSFCQNIIGQRGWLATHIYFAPKTLRAPGKKPAAGNEIQADKAAAPASALSD
jgi:hypothetical protein